MPHARHDAEAGADVGRGNLGNQFLASIRELLAVDALAGQMCRGDYQTGSRINRPADCRKAVWDEVMDKLSAEQKLALKDGAATLAAKPAAPMTASVR